MVASVISFDIVRKKKKSVRIVWNCMKCFQLPNNSTRIDQDHLQMASSGPKRAENGNESNKNPRPFLRIVSNNQRITKEWHIEVEFQVIWFSFSLFMVTLWRISSVSTDDTLLFFSENGSHRHSYYLHHYPLVSFLFFLVVVSAIYRTRHQLITGSLQDPLTTAKNS